MPTIFFATTNPGKQQEIARFAKLYAPHVGLRFPSKDTAIAVAETGTTFEQNATLKAKAYQKHLKDDSIIFVGDDSGIKIPALNNEPGVFTRRWAGYEMTDTEIAAYCLEKMGRLSGDNRKAAFETTLVAVRGNHQPQTYTGQMWGRILEKPLDSRPVQGFPFRSLFWVDQLNIPIFQLQELTPQQRGNFLTHREAALREFFKGLA